ncbi:hypothetical protein J6590_107562, partial [Homalodisca vitripennis]
VTGTAARHFLPTNYNNGTRSGPEKPNEILGCIPSLQVLEMGKNSLRPYGRHY